MQNETKLPTEKINSLLNMFKSGSYDANSVEKMLSDTQKQQINSILSDPEKLRQLLSDPRAKKLMDRFGKNNRGETGNGSS